MIRLKRTEVEAFRIFKDKQVTPEFPEKGIYLINGKNVTTGGSSNSGKSSLVLAINYALDCCPFSGVSLQSHLTKTKLQVKQHLETDTGPLVINRGQDNSITHGDTVVFGSKEISSYLEAVFGLSPKLLSALTYRPQRSGGLFLGMDDTERKEFLSEVLQLEAVEKAVEEAKARIQTLNADLASKASILSYRRSNPLPQPAPVTPYDTGSIKANMAILEGKTKAAREKEVELGNLKADLVARMDAALAQIDTRYHEQLASISNKISEKDNEIKDLLFKQVPQELKDRIKFLQEELSKLQFEHKIRLGDLRDKCKLFEKQYLQGQMIAQRVPDLEKNLASLQEDKKSLEGGTCFTCKQTMQPDPDQIAGVDKQIRWIEVQLEVNRKVDLNALLFQWDALEDKLEAQVVEDAKEISIANAKLHEARTHVDTYEQSKQTAADQVKIKKLELEAAYNKLLNMIAEEKERIKTTHGVNLDEVSKDFSENSLKIASLDAEIRHLDYQINNYHHLNEVNQNSYNRSISNYESFQKITADFEKEQEFLKKSISLEQDFVNMIGKDGFLGAIFDEVLEEISTEASEILKRVPNVATVTVAIKSDKTTQKGEVKKKITPYIYKSGVEIPLQAGLSGGMLSVVELAIDLAVANVISRRTGVVPGWLILDEVFEGLGPVEKEACLEILKEYGQNRLILVISHDNEFKQMFDGAICVEAENEVGKILPEIQ